jgi:hypothetical protein
MDTFLEYGGSQQFREGFPWSHAWSLALQFISEPWRQYLLDQLRFFSFTEPSIVTIAGGKLYFTITYQS